MLSISHKYRMYKYKRLWHKREMASWPKPPNDYQLIRFWRTVVASESADIYNKGNERNMK